MKFPKFTTSPKIIILLLVVFVFGSISSIYTAYQRTLKNSFEKYVSLEETELELTKKNIESRLQEIFNDVGFLSENQSLINYLNNKDENSLLSLQKDFLSFSKNEKKYNQVRFLDSNGLEIVRVDNVGGVSKIIKDDDLQDKSDRYYFKFAMELDESDIFVSPLDLNIENGEIEIPYRPMIRVAKALYLDNEIVGVVVLNYSANEALSTLEDVHQRGSYYGLLNNDSYFIKSPNNQNKWAFMFEGETENILKNNDPELWSNIIDFENTEKKDKSDQSIIVSTRIEPYAINVLDGSVIIGDNNYNQFNSGDYFWYLYTESTPGYVNNESFRFLKNLILFGSVFILIIIIGTLFLLNNIIEQRKDQLELKKFKLAVDNTSDHIVITDSDGFILYANKSVERITGFKIKEIMGKKVGGKETWGGQMSKEFYKKLWQTIKIDKKPFSGELINKRKNGDKYVSLASISPVLDKKRNVLFFIGIERDITKEKEIDKAKTEFVSVASHELKTPLSAINWYTELLLDNKKEKLKPNQKKYVKEIRVGSKRMVDMIDLFLNSTRLDLGTFKISNTEFDLIKKTKEVLKDIKLLAREKKIKINTDFDKDLKKITSDPELLAIVLQNLLSNAVKYTKNKGEVDFSITREERSVLIKVKDNGIGIPQKQQDKIFDKLFRADNVKGGEAKGSGMGLYVTKGIVEKLGGEITFNSKKGKGTEFLVRIPDNSINITKK